MDHPFHWLSDDSIINILDRLLWDPFHYGGNRAKVRIQLASVCKLFRSLVYAAPGLEWDHPCRWLGTAKKFVSHLAACGDGVRKLSKFALLVQGADRKACVLPWLVMVVPHALQTLTEVRLYTAGCRIVSDWHSVLNLLQACPMLKVLEIHQAGFYDRTQMTLTTTKLLGPLSSLVTLTLYGLSVPTGSVAKFLQFFPSLKCLEMHQWDACEDGAIPDGENEAKSASDNTAIAAMELEKVYWWGGKNARLDRVNPEHVDVPRSLGVLVKLLTSGNQDEKGCVLARLEYIFADSDSVSALRCLAKMPVVLLELLSQLEPESHSQSMMSACRILAKFVGELGLPGVLAMLPAVLEGLVRCMVRDDDTDISYMSESECVGPIALNLMRSPASKTVLLSRPQCIRCLVGYAFLSCDERRESLTPAHALEILSNLAGVAPVEDPLQVDFLPSLQASKIPGVIDGIIDSLLDESKAGAQVTAMAVLLRLFTDGLDADVAAIARGRLQDLIGLLSTLSGKLQEDSAKCLQKLVAYSKILLAIAAMPECLRVLVELLDSSENDGLTETVLRVLETVAAWPEGRSAILSLPVMVVPQLMQFLTNNDGSDERARGAAGLLSQLARDPEGVELIASVPDSLLSLLELLESEGGVEGVKEQIAWLFFHFIEDRFRTAVADLPGLFRTLGALLADSNSDELREAGAAVLRNLALDKANEEAIVALPGFLLAMVDGLSSEDCSLAENAAKTLERLSESPSVCMAIVEVPGALQALVGVVCGSPCSIRSVCASAAETLRNLAKNGKIRELIAAVPRGAEVLAHVEEEDDRVLGPVVAEGGAEVE